MQRGFELDLNLCTGCEACAVACAIENELPWGNSWRWVETFNAAHLPELPLYHLSLACNHCADAPCMHHCPALAYSEDDTTGAVLLNPDACIGCKYCTWACPYDAPRYDAAAGVVSKCTFCHHRQQEGLAPACVTQCPTGALQFGGVEQLQGSPIVDGFPRTDANPSIRFVPPRGSAPYPSQAGLAGAASLVFDLAVLAEGLPRRSVNKTSLKSEWPLLVFSLLCSLLVGSMATHAGRELLNLPVFVLLAAVAAGASTLHLGRKERAWRAVLNWRRSWLSREILGFGAFTALSSLLLSGVASGLVPGPWLGGLVTAVGFATLFAIDRVYQVTRTPYLDEHSAQTLLTGLLVAGLVGNHPTLWMSVAMFKLLLYGGRSWRRVSQGRGSDEIPDGPRRGSSIGPGSPVWSVIRMGVGLVLPLCLLVWVTAAPGWVEGMLFAGGEILDRIEFYLELRVPTPARQIEADLRRAGRARAAA